MARRRQERIAFLGDTVQYVWPNEMTRIPRQSYQFCWQGCLTVPLARASAPPTDVVCALHKHLANGWWALVGFSRT